MQTPADIRFDPGRIVELANARIASRPVLNRLKAINPEAFIIGIWGKLLNKKPAFYCHAFYLPVGQ